MKIFLTLLHKEIRHEIRTRESIVSMTVFGISVILLFSFAFNAAPSEFRRFLPGLIWMTYLFTSVLGLLRSFAAEKEMDAYAALLSSPVDRGVIYLAKAAAFWIFLLFTQLMTLPLFGLFLNLPLLSAAVPLACLCLLTDWAIASAGVLISGMGLRTQMGEVLVPVILFPLLVPVLISAAKTTALILSGGTLASAQVWLMLTFTFAVLFTAAGFLTFSAISEE